MGGKALCIRTHQILFQPTAWLYSLRLTSPSQRVVCDWGQCRRGALKFSGACLQCRLSPVSPTDQSGWAWDWPRRTCLAQQQKYQFESFLMIWQRSSDERAALPSGLPCLLSFRVQRKAAERPSQQRQQRRNPTAVVDGRLLICCLKLDGACLSAFNILLSFCNDVPNISLWGGWRGEGRGEHWRNVINPKAVVLCIPDIYVVE